MLRVTLSRISAGSHASATSPATRAPERRFENRGDRPHEWGGRPQKTYLPLRPAGLFTVSTTCVFGLSRAVLTEVKRPVTALRPIFEDFATGNHLLSRAGCPPNGIGLLDRRCVLTLEVTKFP